MTNTTNLEEVSFRASVQPNPTKGSIILLVNTEEKTELDLTIYNSNGQKLSTLFKDHSLVYGENELSLNLENLPPAVYWL